MTPELKDVVGNALSLLSKHPAPWSFNVCKEYGYVVDGKCIEIFGGYKCEGYVSDRDPGIVALVDTVNSLAVWCTQNDKSD